MNKGYRIVAVSKSERTLEFDTMPVVGAQDRMLRAREWRRLLVALAGFWLVFAWALVGYVL